MRLELTQGSRYVRNVDVVANEPAVRLTIFLAVFGFIAVYEAVAPRRRRTIRRRIRWPNNLAVPLLNTLLVRLLLPTTAVGMAILTEERGWGLFHAVTPLPGWLVVVTAVALLDLAIYLQHVLFHAVPLLWRLHRMHHADLDVDVTTGARFHPIEIVISMILKFGVIVALGAPPLAVLVFEVLLSAGSLFNHANLALSSRTDGVLRRLVVTPDMHRVHHSVEPTETNRNFGFILPWWDRLCGTYRAQPAAGHEAMVLGIAQFRTPNDLRLDRLLLQPFLDEATPPVVEDRPIIR
jgi:sterol desaturase/sphingolipid hydroxylase (fatty acid hydroxylase superfamily)